MKLQELASQRKTKQISNVMESYFQTKINVDGLDRGQTKSMLKKVQGLLKEHRSTTARHRSEQNPAYLKLVMMEQALVARLREGDMVPTASTGSVGAAQQATNKVKDPKLAAAIKKSQAGQALNPEEQKLVAGAALMKAESKLRRAYRMLKESEVQQAQVVLAAQDMVDKMQGMLEDVTELQFKELPALVDSIKNQVGIDQAQQFNQDVTAALTGLVQNLQGAKAQLDQALGVVTGTAAPGLPGMDAAAAGGRAGPYRDRRTAAQGRRRSQRGHRGWLDAAAQGHETRLPRAHGGRQSQLHAHGQGIRIRLLGRRPPVWLRRLQVHSRPLEAGRRGVDPGDALSARSRAGCPRFLRPWIVPRAAPRRGRRRKVRGCRRFRCARRGVR